MSKSILLQTIDTIGHIYNEALSHIYSDDSIGKDSIIGKVIVPENIDMSQFDSRTLMYRSIQKLNKPGNLGAILD